MQVMRRMPLKDTTKSKCHQFVHRFFISAPSVFHVGAKEKVLVQMGGRYLNKPVSVYLEDQGILMSEKNETRCSSENDIKIVELMV